MSDKPSKVETAKDQSRYLYGTIGEVLTDPERSGFEHDDLQALKFHGIYQQEDRDQRGKRDRSAPREYTFMIRIGLPGGRGSSDQYLVMDDLAQNHANGSIRLTTRQAFQLHGVVKGELRPTLRGVHEALMTSLAACGDIPRNVVATPLPFADPAHEAVRRLTDHLGRVLKPETGAYYDIWIDGEKVDPPAGFAESFFGETYLPRKFKLAVTLEGDNSVDAYTNDLALVGRVEDGEVVAYDVVVGGGLGLTHNKPETFARIGTAIGSVGPSIEEAEAVTWAVLAVFRDEGNRSNRKQARLKYLVESWGVQRFREAVENELGRPLGPIHQPSRAVQFDHLGRHDQGDGREFVGVWVPNGRISDGPRGNFLSAFRQIAREIGPTVVLTPMQSLLFADLSLRDADKVEEILHRAGIAAASSLSGVQRYAMACPALPTCGLALAEAERVQPSLISELERQLDDVGARDVPLTVRMTGCPNGCARPFNADIGFVGRRPGIYRVYVGGGLYGDRLADLFADDVPFDDIPSVLEPLIRAFGDRRTGGESVGDFYHRVLESTEPRRILTGREDPTRERFMEAIGAAVGGGLP